MVIGFQLPDVELWRRDVDSVLRGQVQVCLNTTFKDLLSVYCPRAIFEQCYILNSQLWISINRIMDIHNSIVDIHKSELWISIIGNHGYP